jgi:NAD(P)-dependent dehydrogenase (short-subunit alcohol dehydrogenase family)
VIPLQLDITSDDSINAALKFIKTTYGHLDILVLNAGIFGLPPGTVDASTLRSNFTTILSTNVISALVMTETFLPLLNLSKSQSPPQTPRIVFVSSSVGSLSQAADPESKYHHPGANEYRASKAALNMLMVQYWVRLKGEGYGLFSYYFAVSFYRSAERRSFLGASMNPLSLCLGSLAHRLLSSLFKIKKNLC